MSNTIQIGDQTYTVQKFSVRKALRAGHLFTEILQEVPDIQQRVSDFTREYREKNSMRVNRATAELRWPEQVMNVSEQAWQASEGRIEIPANPTMYDVAGQMFPLVFEAAEEKALKLLALLVTPNSDLGRAAREGTEDELLDQKVEAMLDEDAAQLADLLVLAAEVLQEQFAGKAARLRQMAQTFGIGEPESELETKKDEPTPTEASNGSKQPTSIDSPPPTDGVTGTPSTPSPSQPSSVSSG